MVEKLNVAKADMIDFIETEYGIRANASGYITPEDARLWFTALKRSAAKYKKFGYFADMRGQRANPPETQAILQESMVWMKQNGLQRAVVVVDSATARAQIIRLAKATGVHEFHRYIDASKDPDWEAKGVRWLTDGIEPYPPENS